LEKTLIYRKTFGKVKQKHFEREQNNVILVPIVSFEIVIKKIPRVTRKIQEITEGSLIKYQTI